MNITDSGAASCALTYINNLSGHKNAEDAMITFCRSYGSSYAGFFYPFYVFVAGPEIPGKGHSSHSGWFKYGTEFAAFITDNKLGKVATAGPRINDKFHPDTTCQVWIWAPDHKAVQAWWKNKQAGG